MLPHCLLNGGNTTYYCWAMDLCWPKCFFVVLSISLCWFHFTREVRQLITPPHASFVLANSSTLQILRQFYYETSHNFKRTWERSLAKKKKKKIILQSYDFAPALGFFGCFSFAPLFLLVWQHQNARAVTALVLFMLDSLSESFFFFQTDLKITKVQKFKAIIGEKKKYWTDASFQWKLTVRHFHIFSLLD